MKKNEYYKAEIELVMFNKMDEVIITSGDGLPDQPIEGDD